MRISNHTFLVTGGASGLGQATCRMLAEAGGRVVIVDMNEAGGRAMAEELGAAARFVRADVRNAEQVQAAVDAAVDLSVGDGLRGTVCCAGIATPQLMVGKEGQPHELELFERVVGINLIGTFNVARLAAAAMAKNQPVGDDGERGVLVHTASVAAWEGQFGQAAYSASKGGVVAMTLPIARELGRHAIRAMAIAPGVFQTPMAEGMPEKIHDALVAMVPYPKRLGRPPEFAALVRHIIENPFLNGSVIRLDGATRIAPK